MIFSFNCYEAIAKKVALTHGRGRHLANCSNRCKISLVWLKWFWFKILALLFTCYTKRSNFMCIDVSSVSSKITFLTGTQLSYFLEILEKLCLLCCKQAQLSLQPSIKPLSVSNLPTIKKFNSTAFFQSPAKKKVVLTADEFWISLPQCFTLFPHGWKWELVTLA